MDNKDVLEQMRSLTEKYKSDMDRLMSTGQRSCGESEGLKGRTATIQLIVNERGRIVEATENGEPLVYAKGDDCKHCGGVEGRTMDDGETCLQYQNPCCWRPTKYGWVCIPCNVWPC